ncbi:MAG TPA: RecX family transcriptional regulator [Anaerolineales bacterium]|nr:RecX family transcriptional regulator [Anaerolineales bacterium]
MNIHLEGNYAFGLTRLTAAWLKVGQELSNDRIMSLQVEDDHERAYQQAMIYLSYRARSESEIRKNLSKHEFAQDVIEHTIERLRENRLADDKQFARAWVENRTAFRPRSRRALQMELRQKGLSDEATQSALEGLNEEALAYEAGLKQARRLRSKEWSEFRKKISEHLARRGFSYSVVSAVVSRIWNETHTEQKINDEEYI